MRVATDAEKLADLMVQLALLKKTKDGQKRDLKIAKASKAATKQAQTLLDATRMTIGRLKRRRDVLVARLVRNSQRTRTKLTPGSTPNWSGQRAGAE